MLTQETPNARRKKNERSSNFGRRSLLSGWATDPTIDGGAPLAPRASAPVMPRRADRKTAEDGICRLELDHARSYLDHLLRLTSEDRRLRFAHTAPDRMIARSIERIDGETTTLFGWIEEGVVRGVVHLAWPDVSWLEGAAELAVSVEAEWQRQGIGRRLVEEAVAEARQRHLPAIRYVGLAENKGLLALMASFGGLTTRAGGEVDGRVDLPVDTLRLPGLSRRSRLGRRRRSFAMSAAVERLNLTPLVG
jgi:GNAT superfamily N-acetyltransferase